MESGGGGGGGGAGAPYHIMDTITLPHPPVGSRADRPQQRIEIQITQFIHLAFFIL